MVSNAIENAILKTSKEYYMQRENVYPFVIFSDSEGKRFIVSFIFDKKNSKLVRLIIDRLFKAEITLNGFVGAIYDWDEHRQRDINVKGRNMARFYTVHKDLINNFNWIDLMCYAPFFHKEDVQKRIIKEPRKAFKKNVVFEKPSVEFNQTLDEIRQSVKQHEERLISALKII